LGGTKRPAFEHPTMVPDAKADTGGASTVKTARVGRGEVPETSNPEERLKRFRNTSRDTVCKLLILRGGETGWEMFRKQVFLESLDIMLKSVAHKP
jgi:hypothetical protein